MLLGLEIFGAIFSILGAYLMSNGTKTDQRPVFYAFISFATSNLALIIFFLLEAKGPMVIQFLVFMSTALFGIYKLEDNKNLAIKILALYLSILSLSLFMLSKNINIQIEFEVIDGIAAIIAVIGSFLLSAKTLIYRKASFICFFVADVLFVYIGINNGFFAFTAQSLFFLWTSYRGYMNLIKEEDINISIA
jgi:hypothetical protein